MLRSAFPMTSSSAAAATTIFRAATGSGDRDTADLGPLSGIKPCLPGSGGTKLTGCVNTASANMPSTEFRGRVSRVNTFTQSKGMGTTETTMTETTTTETTTTEATTTTVTTKGTRSTRD